MPGTVRARVRIHGLAVMKPLLGNHDVTDAPRGIDATGHARKQDVRDVEAFEGELRRHRGVHHADPGREQEHVQPIQAMVLEADAVVVPDMKRGMVARDGGAIGLHLGAVRPP